MIDALPQAFRFNDQRGQSVVKPRGFALIATISVMVLLVMIALAMLSLSTITLRSGRHDTHMQEAQANARLALMLAIGELQASAGPDQRVTATGSLWATPAAGTEHLVGVWNSEDNDGFDTDGDGEPDGDGHPDGGFVRWLVSRANMAEVENIGMVNTAMPISQSDGDYTAGDGYEILVGGGSVAQDPLFPDVMQGVVAEKVNLLDDQGDPIGRYAWWIGDEGVKANVNQIDPYSHALLDQASTPWTTDPQWARLSTQSMQGSSLGAIDSLTSIDPVADSELAEGLNSAINLKQMSLLSFGADLGDRTTRVKQQFHNLTTHSLGLQTNLKEGGLKRDLSLVFELDSSEFDAAGGDFMAAVTATQDVETSNPGTDEGLRYTEAPGPKADLALIFKHAMDPSPLNGGTVGDGIIYGPSWDMLRDYYRMYKGVSVASTPTLNKNWVHTYSPGKAWFRQTGSYTTDSWAWTRTLGLGTLRAERKDAPEANKDTIAIRKVYGQDIDNRTPVVRPTQGAYLPYLSRATVFYSTVATGGNIDVVMQPAIAMHNPYNVAVTAPKMRFLQEVGRFELIVLRSGSDGWSITNTFRTGIHSERGSSAQAGNVYSALTGEDHVSLLTTVFEKDPTHPKGYVFDRYNSELTFNIGESTYEPGEVKLFVANGETTIFGREVDLVEFGGNYDPKNGIYFELDRFDHYVDHDNDDSYNLLADGSEELVPGSPRVQLLKNVPGGDDLVLRINTSNEPTIAYEVYNEELGEYDTAGTYYSKDGSMYGNTMLHKKLSKIQGGNFDNNAPSTVSSLTEPVPNLVMDSFVKPLTHTESLVAPRSPSRPTAKAFPNFMVSNPMAASMAQAATMKQEYNTYGNMIHSNAERFEGDAGSDAFRNLSTGDNGTWGYNHGDLGALRTVLMEIPSAPLQSIGQLQHALLNPMPFYPILSVGNSFRSPYLKNASQVYNTGDTSKGTFVFYDQNYLVNEALWDGYFFSSIAPQPGHGSYTATYPSSNTDPFSSDIPEVIDSFLDGDVALSNSRMKWLRSDADLVTVKADLQDFALSAKHLAVTGAFNVNSTSVNAWTAFLAGYRDSKIQYFDGTLYQEETPDGNSAFLRQSLPGGPGAPADTAIDSDAAWSGFLKLTDIEIQGLATEIVAQIKKRAEFRGPAAEPRPALTLSQFVNRDLTDNLDYGDVGILQMAIQETGVNNVRDTPATEFSTETYNDVNDGKNSYTDTTFKMSAANASPLSLTQGDILQAIAPLISGRSDTFKVRTYGESLDASGNVVARAWCEAVVQRTTEESAPGSTIDFGRKFRLVSFRWLAKDEV